MRFFIYILVSIISLCSANVLAASPTINQGLHLDWIDKSIKPEKDFFAYANGNWMKTHAIPAAYARWGTFDVLQEQNQTAIKHILETAANSHNINNSIEQKVGDFYYSGMNEAAINSAGITPLMPDFERIHDIKNLTDLQRVIAQLHLKGVNVAFNFGQMQDFKNSQQVIGVAFQSGLGLPDRDYYLKNDARFKKIRSAYQVHVEKVFELLGDTHLQASTEAKTVMAIENTLAKISMSRIEQRNPHAVYHMMDIAQLQQITPSFSWQQYFTDIGHPELKHINLAMPDFFKGLNSEFKNVSINDWKVYLRWHLAQAYSSYLSQPFITENLNMVSALTGAKELLPRWKRVVNTENNTLGFAVGKLYVEKNFTASSKQAAETILKSIKDALRKDLHQITWMTPETRDAALKKLDMMGERVGYPDVWRDYSDLTIDRGIYALNVMRANEFHNKRELNKIGKPVDKNEWDMLPQEVNAYYDPSMNRINIPAGILQPPFFDTNAPAAVNYGAIGFVMGHEMTHGFDDAGAQFDGHGNLKNWWSKKDLAEFKNITQRIASQFSSYTVSGNTHVQGKLVMGEATADLGGLILAYRALHESSAYQQALTIGGFTPDQQFFLGAAHVWAMNVRPEEAQRRVTTDPHPPAVYRVNGTLADMSQFRKAFHAMSAEENNVDSNQNQFAIW